MKLPSGIDRMRHGLRRRVVASLRCAAAIGSAQAKAIEEQFQLPVQVSDAYGKRIEQNITVAEFLRKQGFEMKDSR